MLLLSEFSSIYEIFATELQIYFIFEICLPIINAKNVQIKSGPEIQPLIT